MHRSRCTATLLLHALFLSTALAVIDAGVALAGSGGSPKACKLLKPAQIEKILGIPAAKSDIEPTEVAGAENCAYDLGPGLGAPGGGLVTITYYSGPIVRGIAPPIKDRSEPITKGVVYDPLTRSAYIIKPKKVVGVSVSLTDGPPVEERKPELTKLVKAASKRA